VLGLKSGQCDTSGHRFEARVSPVVILKTADTYAETWQHEGAVIASFAERRAADRAHLNAAACAKAGQRPACDGGFEALLDEVTALVERPNVLVPVSFEEAIPGRASGVPDPDDEGQPEVLPAAGCRRAS
jgi:glycyl-tRNA synthetase beta chain